MFTSIKLYFKLTHIKLNGPTGNMFIWTHLKTECFWTSDKFLFQARKYLSSLVT